MNYLLFEFTYTDNIKSKTRAGSRTAATSKMEYFVIIVNGWKPLTIITKHSISDAAAVLDEPLKTIDPLLSLEEICLMKKTMKASEADLGLLQHQRWSAL